MMRSMGLLREKDGSWESKGRSCQDRGREEVNVLYDTLNVQILCIFISEKNISLHLSLAWAFGLGR